MLENITKKIYNEIRLTRSNMHLKFYSKTPYVSYREYFLTIPGKRTGGNDSMKQAINTK